MDDRDKKAKDKARRQSRAARPGAEAVAADEAARFDERIASKEEAAVEDSNKKKSPAASSSRQEESDAAVKARSRRSSKSSAVKPGAVAERSVPRKTDLGQLESDIVAKTRVRGQPPAAAAAAAAASTVSEEQRQTDAADAAAKNRARRSTGAAVTPGAHAQLNDLEDRVAAKARRGTAKKQSAAAELRQVEGDIEAKNRARRSSGTEAATVPGARAQLNDLEDRVASKSRHSSGGATSSQARGSSARTRDQLNDLEDQIAAKTRAARTSQNDVSRLDERINAKVGSSGNSTRTTSSSHGEGMPTRVDIPQDEGVRSPANPAEEDDIVKDEKDLTKQLEAEQPTPQDAAPVTTAARGMINQPDVEHGQYDTAHGLAVAVAVSPEEEDAFIPAAIEYDPDSKPPLYKNRRFRLYGIVGLLLLAVVVVGVSVGVTRGSDNAPTVAPISYRSTLGIQEQIIAVVGEQAMVSDRPGVTTPHKRAMDWIIDEDAQQLLPDSPNLIQRYVLALTYISTTELGPWLSCNPPDYANGDTDECVYMKLIQVFPEMVYEELEWTRWLSSRHECFWAGVFCDEFNQTRAVENYGQEISGTLPKELGLLPFVQSISFTWNNFYGALPAEWGNAKHLLNIELHYNFLTGTIPENWMNARKLQRINLAGNQVEGTIPNNINQLTTLKGIFTYENMMTGTFPTTLGDLKFLTYARIGENFHYGQIPTEMGKLTKLQELWAHRTQMTGTLPTEFGLMEDLVDIRMHFNPMKGTIPDEWYGLEDLERFDIYDCAYTGTLSTEVGRLQKLDSIRIRANKFTGTIPTEIGLLRNLKEVWLHRNQFEGSIPDEMCDLRGPSNLQMLEADCGPTDITGPPAVSCQINCCTSCCDRATGICLLEN